MTKDLLRIEEEVPAAAGVGGISLEPLSLGQGAILADPGHHFTGALSVSREHPALPIFGGMSSRLPTIDSVGSALNEAADSSGGPTSTCELGSALLAPPVAAPPVPAAATTMSSCGAPLLSSSLRSPLGGVASGGTGPGGVGVLPGITVKRERQDSSGGGGQSSAVVAGVAEESGVGERGGIGESALGKRDKTPLLSGRVA